MVAPADIPKYVNQLVVPPVYEPTIIIDPSADKVLSHDYVITVSQFQQQILPPPLPPTTVWGYGGKVKDPATGNIAEDFKNAPGATFEAIRGIPINVQWVNNLTGPHLLPVDPTLHWADPKNMPMSMPPFNPYPPGYPEAQSPVPIVTHLHGGEVQSIFDGHPDAWFTVGENIKGPAFVTSRYNYPNKQLPTTLWYHDHALGITRLNVLMGLAGFYLLRDPNDPLENILPKGKYEIPLVIQDRSFNPDGSFFFPNAGINPGFHPYWVPEFFGDTIMVNGKVWPYLDVERRQYRFRVLNGSNARFYNLKFSNGQSFVQIGTDGGYLAKPVTLTSLLVAPGERADILVDFSTLTPNTKIILLNDAKAPYPGGDPADPETVGQIMQFTILAGTPVEPAKLPATLNTMPFLFSYRKRTLTLNEVMGPAGPVEILLNGQKWGAPISEFPEVGSTEEWKIVNFTVDTHPIHLHLVQFQIINRQKFNTILYQLYWGGANGKPPLNHPTRTFPIEPFLKGQPVGPAPNEMGWKDTVRVNPGEVATIRVRYAPQDAKQTEAVPGTNLYPFDPTIGPGYVWHCHILDHEDNEMMRPYIVT